VLNEAFIRLKIVAFIFNFKHYSKAFLHPTSSSTLGKINALSKAKYDFGDKMVDCYCYSA
jgi:hypothetical protein